MRYYQPKKLYCLQKMMYIQHKTQINRSVSNIRFNRNNFVGSKPLEWIHLHWEENDGFHYWTLHWKWFEICPFIRFIFTIWSLFSLLPMADVNNKQLQLYFQLFKQNNRARRVLLWNCELVVPWPAWMDTVHQASISLWMEEVPLNSLQKIKATDLCNGFHWCNLLLPTVFKNLFLFWDVGIDIKASI